MASLPHVMMTADTVGGVFTYSLELSAALARLGARVTLCTMGEPLSPAQWDLCERVPGLHVFEGRYRLEWMDDPWDDVGRAAEWLLDIERRTRPDVIHVNGYAHGAAAFSAPTLVVAPSCVLSWWRAVLGNEAPATYDRYRAEVRKGLSAARAVVAPTRAMLAAVTEHYGPVARGTVIENAVDPAPYRLGLKEPFALAVGRLWDQAKNVAALGAVAPKLPFPIYVAGSDMHPDGARRPIPALRTLGVLARQVIAGWLSRAAIYALPARYEPFGLSVLEAALSGCALVLGDIPSLREVWGDAALYVAPDDHEALRWALGALMKQPEERAAFGTRARARAERHAPERMARRYLDVYAELCSKAPALPSRSPTCPNTVT